MNQDDVDERNAQVPLMKHIFGQAETVHTWLGPETEGTSQAIRKLDDLYHGHLRAYTILSDDNDGTSTMTELEALTQCLWWRRVGPPSRTSISYVHSRGCELLPDFEDMSCSSLWTLWITFSLQVAERKIRNLGDRV